MTLLALITGLALGGWFRVFAAPVLRLLGRPLPRKNWEADVLRAIDRERILGAARSVFAQDFAFSEYRRSGVREVAEFARWRLAIAVELREPGKDLPYVELISSPVIGRPPRITVVALGEAVAY